MLKRLHVLFESADACISAMAFNAIVAKLFWFGEVTGLNANNAKAWHETFGKLYWELSVTAIGCSAKGPGSWEISADGCISAVAFNAVFGKLICFVEVTGSNANNVKAWRETVGVEDAWTFTARD
jgi:hypothetical protein